MLTKQLQVLKTAESTMPEMKDSTIRMMSDQSSCTSWAMCWRKRVRRDFFESMLA